MTALPRNTMAVVLHDLLQLAAVDDDIEACVRDHPVHVDTRVNGRVTAIYGATYGIAELIANSLASIYLSTGCYHGRHEHCCGAVRIDGGEKVPGRCKFCAALCICPCHRDGGDLSGVDLSVYRHQTYVQHERDTEGEAA